jgi:chemotaxis methyl-accepting protein methylase
LGPRLRHWRRGYSIAIVLLEYLGERAGATRVQIFGTDLSDVAVEKARAGFYADSIAWWSYMAAASKATARGSARAANS